MASNQQSEEEKALSISEGDDSKTLIDRGKALQKRMRKKKSKEISETVTKDDIEMVKTGHGLYKKASSYYEVSLKKSDFYDDVLLKASLTLNLQEDVNSLVIVSASGAIVRASGAIVPNEPLKFGKGSGQWTVGRYLHKLHVCPDKLHLAIGIDSKQMDHELYDEEFVDDIDMPSSKKPAVADYDSDVVVTKVSTTPSTTPRSQLSPVNNAEIHSPHVMSMTPDEVKAATLGFDRSIVIGKGGFGVVYKVKNFRSLGTTVAIKVLNKDGIAALKASAEMQLESEVFALTKFRHPNVVDMMAYSCTKQCCAIVYTYMCNGSLFDKLHKEKGKDLTWPIRRRILIDSCRGLAFLHASSPPLVHQDIKSSNILLDEYYCAKISDFGFAIDLPQIKENKTMVTAPVIARTEGYFPPELTTGKFSDKSDVYSYGVVALETYTGLQAYVDGRCDPKLTELTEDDRKTVEGFTNIYDNKLSEPDGSLISEVYEVVTKCLQRHSKRPNSAEVLQIWEIQN